MDAPSFRISFLPAPLIIKDFVENKKRLQDMYGLTIDKIDDTVCLHLDKNISKPGGQL